jgi:ferric-dicitrate binding protein FerR (iron transport regulator)
MEKKEKKIIAVLIRKFYENSLTPEMQSRFQAWFINGKAACEKRESMQNLWDEADREQNQTTIRELNIIRRRIGNDEKERRNKRFQWFFRAAVLLLLPLLSLAVTLFLKKETVVFIEPELVENVVAYGERKQIILPDGSEVWLNSGSLLIHEKEFAGKIRSVHLYGEANFSVAANKKKPFIVKTAYMDVEALGTVFNVQSYADTELSIATLEEGKVRITPKQEDITPVVLSPNQQLIYNRISKTVTTRQADAARLSMWKKGYLMFRNDSFESIAKTLERRFNVKINYRPGKYADRNFTIRFSPDEDIDDILNVLKDLVHFKYRKEGNTVYIL